MKKRIIRIAFVIGVGLLAWGCFHVARFGWAVWGIAQSERADWRRFQSLVATNDHSRVAHEAIAVIRSTTRDVLIQDAAISNLPPAIADMRPSYVTVHPQGMGIEFHGGFDHYGFGIMEVDGGWEMLWYTEKKRQRLLTIPKTGDEKANQALDATSETAPGAAASSPQG